MFGVSTCVVHRPNLNLEKQNLLPGPNSVCEVEEGSVCEADARELEATERKQECQPNMACEAGVCSRGGHCREAKERISVGLYILGVTSQATCPRVGNLTCF